MLLLQGKVGRTPCSKSKQVVLGRRRDWDQVGMGKNKVAYSKDRSIGCAAILGEPISYSEEKTSALDDL